MNNQVFSPVQLCDDSDSDDINITLNNITNVAVIENEEPIAHVLIKSKTTIGDTMKTSIQATRPYRF